MQILARLLCPVILATFALPIMADHIKRPATNPVANALHDRAKTQIATPSPDILKIISDLARADAANLSVALTWAMFHETMGEIMLIANANCIADNCPQDINALSAEELRSTYSYNGLRSYYGALETALYFYHDYMYTHHGNISAQQNIDRIEDRLDLLNSVIKSKLEDLYR